MINKRLSKFIHPIITDNPRVTAVCYSSKNGNDLIFSSIYMPFDDGSNQHYSDFEEVVGVMQGLMDRYLGCKLIFGGDFNVTRPSNAVIYHTIDKFCVANRLEWLDPAPDGVNYTYHNDAVLTHSLIDHFICSPELVQSQQYVYIMDDGDNLSDHYAIHYPFKLPCGHADSHHSHSPELARKLL